MNGGPCTMYTKRFFFRPSKVNKLSISFMDFRGDILEKLNWLYDMLPDKIICSKILIISFKCIREQLGSR